MTTYPMEAPSQYESPSMTAQPYVKPTSSSKTVGRVWAVIEYYQPNFSGAAIQAHRILSRLPQFENFDRTVLTMADQEARVLRRQTTNLDGIEVHYLPVPRRRRLSWLAPLPPLQRALLAVNDLRRKLRFNLEVAARLWRHATANDVLQLYVVDEFTWLPLIVARHRQLASCIQISLVGADDPSSFRRSLLGISTYFKRACFQQVERVICLSSALSQSCRLAGIDEARIEQIPNGLELGLFRPAGVSKEILRTKLALPPHHRMIAFVGSAIARKGIDVAVRAFILAADQIPDCDLLIIGPCDFSDRSRHDPSRDALVAELRREINDAGLHERVHWIGQVNHVQDYLQASELFFFPTRREGLPNAMAEAMACGLPVLASRVDGVTTDLVPDERLGRLIEGHAAADYAGQLVAMLTDSALLTQISDAARRHVETVYDLQQIVQRYAELYREVIREKNEKNRPHRTPRGLTDR